MKQLYPQRTQRKQKTAYSKSSVISRLISLAALCVAIRIFAPAIESAAAAYFSDTQDTALYIVSSQVGHIPENEESSPGFSLLRIASLFKNTLSFPNPFDKLTESKPEDGSQPDTEPNDGSQSDTEIQDDPAPEQDAESDVPPAVETTITGDSGSYTKASEGIYLKNKTGYDIDVDALLAESLNIPDGTSVLIIHTHGSESFTPADGDVYEESDPYRTEDKNYNVIRLGDELTQILTDRGITVIHDRELYDYPSYSGSYTRAYESICKYLEEYPEISVVIDLHRDALMADDGTVYKTVADVGDEPCSQVMIIAGTNWSGLDHPKWRENLKFAINIQAEMVEKYPSLARPLSISQYRYNQHATIGSLIVEIGCNGNTLQEGLNAVTYFGDCLANVLTGE